MPKRIAEPEEIFSLIFSGKTFKECDELLGYSRGGSRQCLRDAWPSSYETARNMSRRNHLKTIRKEKKKKRYGITGPGRMWTREAVIERIQAWTEIYGDTPSAQDWLPAMARRNGREDIAIRFEQDGCWPHYSTVISRFGSWNAGIAAAGYTPRKNGHRKKTHASK